MKNIVIAMITLLLVGCGSGKSETIDVVTSVYPAYDFALKIAGEGVNVKNIMPSGADAHGFEPTPKDLATIQEADIFIYHGAGLEAWVDKAFESLDLSDVKVVSLADVSTLLIQEESETEHAHEHENEAHEDHDEHDGHDHGVYDVHTWLSMDNAQKQMNAIKEALISVDADNAEVYETNYSNNVTKLDSLRSEYEILKSYGDHLHILVDHKAYGYLGASYGIHQLSILRGTLSEEPTAAELQESIQYIKDNNVEAIYVSPNSSLKVYDIIKSETGVMVLPLHTLETLTKSELDQGMEYFSIMLQNLDSLKEGLSHEGHNH